MCGSDGEFDKLKLYEQISTNEHLSLPSVGQAHRFATPQATSSEEAKNYARDGDKLKLYEQLSTDEQIGQAPSFGRHEAAPSGDQKNVGREGEFDKLKSYEQLSADECLETVPRQAHRFATHEAGPSGEQKNLGKEGDFDKLKWVFAELSGRIQGMKAQESCAFVSELDFGEGFDLASEMDDKSGEATSATLGFVLLPGFSAGTDGMRRFR